MTTKESKSSSKLNENSKPGKLTSLEGKTRSNVRSSSIKSTNKKNIIFPNNQIEKKKSKSNSSNIKEKEEEKNDSMGSSSKIKKKQDQDEKGQKFNSEWKNKESPLYKPWIDEVIGKSTKCRCKWCSRDFKVENMYGPHGHCNSDKHIKYNETYQKKT